MTNGSHKKPEPLVTVLISTYNRPNYVRQAIESILHQSYRNIEAILVRDGGLPVRQSIEPCLSDRRLTFIDRDQNRGLPYSFNEALSHAEGKYVCYLGDDDLFYPNHVRTLVDALEGQDEYGAAYTDLYKVHCRIEQDGTRTVLAKNIEITRDYDRTALLQFNHILHVSLMHRRDLLDKIGPCNEKLWVLIDWDLTRRLSFFTAFKHIHKVTGEYYAAIEKYQSRCERISSRKQNNRNAYILNHLTILSTRPEKPWPESEDLSIILLADSLDAQMEQCLRQIWSHTFFPYQIYLPLCKEQLSRLQTIVPNILGVPVETTATAEEKLDAALQCCDGEYTAIVPSGWQIGFSEVAWIEKSLYALINDDDPSRAYELIGSEPWCWASVFTTPQLRRARRFAPHLPIRQSILNAGIKTVLPKTEQWPFQMENLVTNAQVLEKESEWLDAARFFEQIPKLFGNDLWMRSRCANALYHAGKYELAAQFASEINNERQAPSTLLIEARARNKLKDSRSAIKLLNRAVDILEGRECAYA